MWIVDLLLLKKGKKLKVYTHILFKKKLNFRIQFAIEAVHRGSSIRNAAKQFSVVFSTLQTKWNILKSLTREVHAQNSTKLRKNLSLNGLKRVQKEEIRKAQLMLCKELTWFWRGEMRLQVIWQKHGWNLSRKDRSCH